MQFCRVKVLTGYAYRAERRGEAPFRISRTQDDPAGSQLLGLDGRFHGVDANFCFNSVAHNLILWFKGN
jgi:hypothetical protein